MTSDQPPDYDRNGGSGVLAPRENDVLAEICRAVARRGDVGELIQEACERLQVYFGAASIGAWFLEGGDLILKGLCVPDRFGDEAVRMVREDYASVSLDDDLPGPRAMRERRILRLASGDPSLTLQVREILGMLDVSVLLAIPAYADGDPIGCGLVGVPDHGPLTAADQSLLENALGVLAVLHHRARLQRRDAALHRQLLETSHLAAVGDLTATIAHELNNPLGAVEQFAEELLLQDDVPSGLRESLEGIRTEANRATMIVRSLLDFTGSGAAPRRAVDVRETLENVRRLLPPSLLGDVEVVVEAEPDTPPAWVDPRGLQQVLHNVLIHSCRAMESAAEDLRILVRAREEGDAVHVIVEDQGPPLPPGYERGSFTPFFRSDQPRHGLGLSLAEGVLRDNGGRLRVEEWGEPGHEDPSRGGARFIVSVPRAGPAGDERHPDRSPENPFVDLEILLVEDEELVAEATRKLLERLGCRVEAVASAEEALERIGPDASYRVILSDVRMPGIGGLGLYRELEERRPDLLDRVIFTSGDVVSPELRKFLAEVQRPILPKPYELDELRAVLLEMLREGEPGAG